MKQVEAFLRLWNKNPERGQWIFRQYSLVIPFQYLASVLDNVHRGWEGL